MVGWKGNLECTEACQVAFSLMKEKLITLRVFSFPDFNHLFIMETDDYKIAVSAYSFEKSADGTVHTEQFASGAMNTVE